MLEKLENTLRDTRTIGISVEDDLNKIEELKYELNEYVELLHRPYGRTKMTPFGLYGVKEKAMHHFENFGRNMPRFNIPSPKKWNMTQWRDANFKFKELAELYKMVKPIQDNPWNTTQPDPILPAEQEEIESLLKSSQENLDELNFRAQTFISTLRSKSTGYPGRNGTRHRRSRNNILFPLPGKKIILNPQWDYDDSRFTSS